MLSGLWRGEFSLGLADSAVPFPDAELFGRKGVAEGLLDLPDLSGRKRGAFENKITRVEFTGVHVRADTGYVFRDGAIPVLGLADGGSDHAALVYGHGLAPVLVRIGACIIASVTGWLQAV